jgi:X-Pro dipeptidyl-peptidase
MNRPAKLRRPGLASALPTLLLVTATASAQEAATRSEPVFTDGEAQIVEGFKDPKAWIREELWVEAEFDTDGDGLKDRMHVDVTRQKQTDTEGLKVAVIYETSPYFSGVGSTDSKYFWDPHQEVHGPPKPREHMPSIAVKPRTPRISEDFVADWLPRGFAVVHSESPGTGLSQGCPSVGGPNESLAPKAVIDWLNGRAKGFTKATGGEEVKAYWSTGKVGMSGTSYNGTLPIAAATTGVEGLEAIIPVSPNSSYYHYYRSNGLVRHPGGYMGEDMDVLFEFIDSGNLARRNFCEVNTRDEVLLKSIDRVSGDYNDFWAARDYWNQLGRVHAATLLAHGLNDWNVMPEHSVHVFEALKAKGVPTQLYLHQGGHGGDPPLKLMNRWFTRFLYDVENGVEDDPKCWVVREHASRGEPTPYPDYPNPEAKFVTLHVGAGGAKIGELALAPAHAVAAAGTPGKAAPAAAGVEALVDDAEVSGETLAKAESSNHRLLYATPPLSSPVHTSGTPRVKVRLSCSKPAANLSVWLVALPWTDSRDINDHLINRGWADPQNRDSLTKSAPLELGRFYDVAFDLEPDDQVIPAGKRIALMIFSSDHDFTLWPEPGTELGFEIAATSLELPVVGGADAWKKATAPAADTAKPKRN